jgi:hypothetical protein
MVVKGKKDRAKMWTRILLPRQDHDHEQRILPPPFYFAFYLHFFLV